MHHLETTTKQKYQAFVHEFERSRKNLFQNVKPQLGKNKSIDLLLKEGGSSLHIEGAPRKIYAPHLNDSVRPLIKEPEYPPEKLKSPNGFSPNQSHQSCFPKSPMTLKDINRTVCNSTHHINCKHTAVEPPASKKKHQPASGGKYQNTNHSTSYSQIWQDERESHLGHANNSNENYILSVVTQENLPKNSYSHRFQFKKLMSNNAAQIIQQWYRDRKSPKKSRSPTSQPRREWVGTRSFKNSRYYGRNDFYPQKYSPSRTSKQNSYYEYEEAEASRRRTPFPVTGLSSRADSKENSFRSPLSNRKNAPGTPERNKETKVNSQRANVTPAVNNTNNQKKHFSYPQHSNQLISGLRSGQLDNKIILGAVLNIQKAWRKALASRRHRGLDAQNFGGSYHTGSFDASKDTPPKNSSKRTGASTNEQTEHKINELHLLVEQLTFELRLANKNITFLKHENDKLKGTLENIEQNIQVKVDEKIAVEKLNNSELVNQYVSVVETLLEEKKELSQRTEKLSSQMKEAEDIIKSQNEALLKNQREIETKIRIQEENNRLRSDLENIQTEVKALKQELANKPSDDEYNLHKARSEEYEQRIQEMSKKLQEYETSSGKNKKKNVSQEGSPQSARGQNKGRASTRATSVSEENEKLKKDSSRSKLAAEEISKGNKSPSEKPNIGQAQDSPEKRMPEKDPTAEKKISSSRVSTPEKKSSDQSRKSSVSIVEGKGSPPGSGARDKGTSTKKGSAEAEKSANKSTAQSNKARKTLVEKPSIDEMPLQTKQRSDSVGNVNTKAVTKQSPVSQGQKSGGVAKAKDGTAKTKDLTTSTKKKKSTDDAAKQQQEQSPEKQGSPAELSFDNNKPEEKKIHVSFSKDEEFNPTEKQGYYSFGSPDSKQQPGEPQKEPDQKKRADEGISDTSLKEDEFDKMDEIHQDIMSRFGKLFSTVDEGLLLKHLEEENKNDT